LPGAAVDRIGATTAVDRVCFGAAADQVFSSPASDRIGAGAAHEGSQTRIRRIRMDRVIPTAAESDELSGRVGDAESGVIGGNVRRLRHESGNVCVEVIDVVDLGGEAVCAAERAHGGMRGVYRHTRARITACVTDFVVITVVVDAEDRACHVIL
jgi:hypothetical protein